MLKLNLHFLLITINLFALAITDSIPDDVYKNLVSKDANIAEFPHQVSLRCAETKIHFCGGAVLNESFIITAAHCTYHFDRNVALKASDFFIVAGQTELKLHDKSITRDIKACTRHPRYIATRCAKKLPLYESYYDVALLELKEKLPPFSETKLIQPIKLSDTELSSNLNCTVTGWGQIAYRYILIPFVEVKRKSSETLKKHDFRTKIWKECKSSHGKKWKMEFIFRKNITFCTESIPGNDDEEVFKQEVCEPADDSGGPLVCNGLLTGIVSHGTFCDFKNHPGVYFDVQGNLDWIKRNKSDENDDDVCSPTGRGRGRGRKRKSSSPKRFSFNYLCLLVIVIAYAIKF